MNKTEASTGSLAFSLVAHLAGLALWSAVAFGEFTLPHWYAVLCSISNGVLACLYLAILAMRK